ncbi:MAG: sigma-70 family RNA polymerase sigma factor [Pseudomonadota bacterium]
MRSSARRVKRRGGRGACNEDRADDVETLPSHGESLSGTKDQDRLTFEALYQDNAAVLANNLRKLFGAGPPDPEDIVQQAFQKVLERDTLEDIDSLPNYLWRTARNIMITAKRKDDTRSNRDFDVEQIFFPTKGVSLSPENVFSARNQLARINDVLAAMPKTRQRAFYLHRIDGLSISETARRLGLSRSAITKHIVKAAKEIDQALAEGGD